MSSSRSLAGQAKPGSPLLQVRCAFLSPQSSLGAPSSPTHHLRNTQPPSAFSSGLCRACCPSVTDALRRAVLSERERVAHAQSHPETLETSTTMGMPPPPPEVSNFLYPLGFLVITCVCSANAVRTPSARPPLPDFKCAVLEPRHGRCNCLWSYQLVHHPFFLLQVHVRARTSMLVFDTVLHATFC